MIMFNCDAGEFLLFGELSFGSVFDFVLLGIINNVLLWLMIE